MGSNIDGQSASVVCGCSWVFCNWIKHGKESKHEDLAFFLLIIFRMRFELMVPVLDQSMVCKGFSNIEDTSDKPKLKDFFEKEFWGNWKVCLNHSHSFTVHAAWWWWCLDAREFDCWFPFLLASRKCANRTSCASRRRNSPTCWVSLYLFFSREHRTLLGGKFIASLEKEVEL